MSGRYKDFMVEELEAKKILHFKRLLSENSPKSYLEICEDAEVFLGTEGKVGTGDDSVQFLEVKISRDVSSDDDCKDSRTQRMKSFHGQCNIKCVHAPILTYATELKEKAASNTNLNKIFTSIAEDEYLTMHQKEYLSKEALSRNEIPSQLDISDGECLTSSKRC